MKAAKVLTDTAIKAADKVSAWLEAVLLKACAREVQDRFETAEEFLLALERGASRPLATRRRVPLLERNPRLALKIVAALSLALNVVLLYLLSRH